MARFPLFDRYRETLNLVASLCQPGEQVWVVGGTLRDHFLGRETHDVDLAVQGDARALGRKTADRLGGAYVDLDPEHGFGRVILNEEGQRFILDFAALRGADLVADLAGRDFTINAMAAALNDPDTLIDPLGGLCDLQSRLLRPCAPDSLSADPLRILRAVRLAAAFGCRLDEETLRQAREATPLLPRVSAERQRDELFRLFELPRLSAALEVLESLGALPLVLPEISRLRGVEQGPPHVYDAWGHTLAVVSHFQDVYAALVEPFREERVSNLTLGYAVLKLGRFREALRAFYAERLVPERSLQALITFSALYHDSGKAETRSVGSDGRVHFYEHDQRAALLAVERGKALALSNAEVERLAGQVRGHMRIHWLAKDVERMDARLIHRYYRALGPAGVDVCLISLADLLGITSPAVEQARWQKEVDLAEQLLAAWFEQQDILVRPVRLVNGHDLQEELGLTPGPLLGQLLEFVTEAQVAGEVSDKKGALDWVRAWLERNSQLPGRG